MKSINTLIVLLILFPSILVAQYFEAGIFAGVSNYQGDLAPGFMEASEYAPAFGVFGRYNFTGHLGMKVHLYKGTLQGSDENGQLKYGIRQRNLSFQSDLYELGVQGEFNFINFNVLKGDHITTPYLFAGVSGFYFNPIAELNGQLHELQPLGTEGQGINGYDEKYKLFSIAIPAGLGVKFNFNKTVNVGLEMGLRYTFTDYLDDVSGKYPDLEVLTENNGELATMLSYRTAEYDNNITTDPQGQFRGGEKQLNDFYFFGGLILSFNIGQVREFEKRKKKPRKQKKPKMGFLEK